MCSPQRCKRGTGDVLDHQGNHCDRAEDQQRLTPALQGSKLCRQTDCREKDQQQGVLDTRAEDDVEIQKQLQEQHGDRHDHGADHGVGHVDLSQERNGLTDVSTDEECDNPDDEG